jgi:chromosome segregation ATPase
MMQKRDDRDQSDASQGETLLAVETARSAAGGGKVSESKKDEEHISVFWRVFGGTILSIVALVAITLYNNLTAGIADLRADLSREREARADMIKKDEVNTRVTAIFDRLRGIEAVKVELEGLKEKVSANAAAVTGTKKDTAAVVDGARKDMTAALDAVKKDTTAAVDALKKDAATVEVLKERVAALEGVKKDLASLDVLKERMTAVATELKSVRDEVVKVAADVDRNKASDSERKNARDAQYKQLDETMKDLQRGLQDCREKLARLEGAKPSANDIPVRPVPPSVAKPTSPPATSEVKPAGGTAPSGTGKPTPVPETPDDE